MRETSLHLQQSETVYGTQSWLKWREERARNLKTSKTAVARVASDPPFQVNSFEELVRVVSFLNVMNKMDVLLFRGQRYEVPLLPTLLRDSWAPPRESGIAGKVALSNHRHHYWTTLQEVSEKVLGVLHDDTRPRLPRWRPFDPRFRNNPLAVWAVIQHYEIWPTPLLDLTSSLRVAASFALGPIEHGEESSDTADEMPRERHGYLYVFRVRGVVSDLMVRLANMGVQAIRLNAVCPPDAKRPHYQEGFLLARTDAFDEACQLNPAATAHTKLVAKFELVSHGAFWSRDFPPHAESSLLPSEHEDELLQEFRKRIEYRRNGDVISIR